MAAGGNCAGLTGAEAAGGGDEDADGGHGEHPGSLPHTQVGSATRGATVGVAGGSFVGTGPGSAGVPPPHAATATARKLSNVPDLTSASVARTSNGYRPAAARTAPPWAAAGGAIPKSAARVAAYAR